MLDKMKIKIPIKLIGKETRKVKYSKGKVIWVYSKKNKFRKKEI